MNGEEGGRREAAQVRREGGRLLRADEDPPPGQLLDPAGEARDLLQETIDSLPAGVVVYDQNERLEMFNAAAARPKCPYSTSNNR